MALPLKENVTASEQSASAEYEDTRTIVQHFAVPIHYPVYFSSDILNARNPVLSDAISHAEPQKRHRLFVAVDREVVRAWPQLGEDLVRYVQTYSHLLHLAAGPWVISGGESAKNNPTLPVRVQKRLHDLGMDRQSVVLVIGGGAVLDMVGYAAAVTHRGLRVVRCPTTLLAQADGGLGVKTAINAFETKNFLGVFAAPFAIVNDRRFLETLPRRHLISGMAEAVKVALIRDVTFFAWLEENVDALAALEPAAVAVLIRRSAELHLHHIATGGDPFESGSVRPLDFGHWAAHKLESLSAYALHHGEAVAIGIAIDAFYSVELGWLSKAGLRRILRLFQRLGIGLWSPFLDGKDENGRLSVLQGLQEFREHIGGSLVLTMLKDIGTGRETMRIDELLFRRSLTKLKGWQLSRCVSR